MMREAGNKIFTVFNNAVLQGLTNFRAAYRFTYHTYGRILYFLYTTQFC